MSPGDGLLYSQLRPRAQVSHQMMSTVYPAFDKVWQTLERCKSLIPIISPFLSSLPLPLGPALSICPPARCPNYWASSFMTELLKLRTCPSARYLLSNSSKSQPPVQAQSTSNCPSKSITPYVGLRILPFQAASGVLIIPDQSSEPPKHPPRRHDSKYGRSRRLASRSIKRLVRDRSLDRS